jgi:hypothetical protein
MTDNVIQMHPTKPDPKAILKAERNVQLAVARLLHHYPNLTDEALDQLLDEVAAELHAEAAAMAAEREELMAEKARRRPA